MKRRAAKLPVTLPSAASPALPEDLVLLRPRELAAALSVSTRRGYELIADGGVAAILVRGALRVRVSDLRVYLEREARPATPDAVRRVGGSRALRTVADGDKS